VTIGLTPQGDRETAGEMVGPDDVAPSVIVFCRPDAFTRGISPVER